jgi:nitric oxide reductase NorD protein
MPGASASATQTRRRAFKDPEAPANSNPDRMGRIPSPRHDRRRAGSSSSALGDRHAVYAFSGRGPGDVRVLVAKRFSEAWSESVRGRIGAIQPDRSTRLGGPLRHATAELARLPARARLLLVLSDGKPDDEDVYEGRYGLEDVRQAVFEARRVGVHPFCVTIDRRGPSYLPHLFGASGYTVLWDLRQLPARLPALYRRLAV